MTIVELPTRGPREYQPAIEYDGNRKRARRSAWIAIWIALTSGALLALIGCGTASVKDGDVYLTGKAAEIARHATGAQAITISEKKAFFFSENPPSDYVICHEGEHKKQAEIVGDALVLIGAISDDELSRAAAWVSIYTVDYAQHGYVDNRWEQGAREACKGVSK